MEVSAAILSDITVHMKYAKHIPHLERRETWDEIVTRNKMMHLKKYPHLWKEIEDAYTFVYDRKVLPSMRSMQFGGKPIELNNARMFNCCFIPIDHPTAFSEIMFLLLSGCGVGYSVQHHHVDKLPPIQKNKRSRKFVIDDSIIGWADAVKALVSSYFKGKSFPVFDFSEIRPKGAALITSGGKAPGPEPLKDCIHNVQKIFDRKQDGEKLTSLEVHDINCYIADAVLAGGIRRSAMIALFDFDDDEMLECKFGNWYELNPQRGRANNSAMILRHKIKKEDFINLWKKIEASGAGEPGFFFSNDKDWGTNPCVEVSLKPFQCCNLTTINVSDVNTQNELDRRAIAAAFIGTLQASYTDFHYLRDIWRRTTEKEALIGVSMTGIASGGILSLDLERTANLIKAENTRVATLIEINEAARCTVVKPEGTASLVVGSSSGIHAWHSKYYMRRIRVGKNEPIYQYILNNHPDLLEDEYFRPETQAVIKIPVKAPDGAITREESALALLSRVKQVWSQWIKPGHRKGENINNVSTTVTIKEDEWEEVGEWMWNNRNYYTGLSCLPLDNGTYIQAPFTEITKEEYENAFKHLTKIDLKQVIELNDSTALHQEVACGGGSCEII